LANKATSILTIEGQYKAGSFDFSTKEEQTATPAKPNKGNLAGLNFHQEMGPAKPLVLHPDKR
jgi:hypothetical protein